MKQYINEYDEALDAITSGVLDTSDIEPYMDTIVGALKKQIPQKARNVFHDTYGLARGMCPVCINSISEISLYCNMCGQRVFFDREDA